MKSRSRKSTCRKLKLWLRPSFLFPATVDSGQKTCLRTLVLHCGYLHLSQCCATIKVKHISIIKSRFKRIANKKNNSDDMMKSHVDIPIKKATGISHHNMNRQQHYRPYATAGIAYSDRSITNAWKTDAYVTRHGPCVSEEQRRERHEGTASSVWIGGSKSK